jgi:hypothetical protein
LKNLRNNLLDRVGLDTEMYLHHLGGGERFIDHLRKESGNLRFEHELRILDVAINFVLGDDQVNENASATISFLNKGESEPHELLNMMPELNTKSELKDRLNKLKDEVYGVDGRPPTLITG